MTNAEIIQAIRAEIERRLKNTRDYMNGAGMKYKGPKYHASRGRESAYDAILSFLSTLESEKPMNQEELEKEIEKFLNKTGAPYVWCNDDEQKEWCSIIARHFAKWQKEQIMKEAVEGTIDDCGTPARLRLEMPGGSFRIGDKVRVIVLPKEDRL